MSSLLDLFILSTACAHVLLTPHTKVEESFNLHAVHDVLMYGIAPKDLHNYDHFVFPGAVPRTFVGSVLLGWCSTPLIHAAKAVDLISSKADLLVCVRLTLGLINGLGLCLLRRAVSKRFGFATAALFTIFTCTQFHLPFWMGRTLPNMFALLPVNLALAFLLNQSPNAARPSQRSLHSAISLLTCASIVFRGEVLLLLGPLALQALVLRWTSLMSVAKVGLVSAIGAISLTVLIDSYFWNRWPLWPELYGIYFNVVQGKSSEWGVSPFHAYISTHIPKLSLTSLPLALLGFIADARVRSLLLAPIAYVILISCLGHKEWRFVVYVVPVINVAAARGARWIIQQRSGTIFGRLCVAALVGCIAANSLVTFFMTEISRDNYPGGVALSRFNEMFSSRPNVHVHISNLAAQTGASLFLQEHAPPYLPVLNAPTHSSWIYNKTETLSPADLTSAHHFTHLIVEDPTPFASTQWRKVECVKAFAGLNLRRHGPVVGSLGEARNRDGEGLDLNEGSVGGGVDDRGLWAKLPLVEVVRTEKLCILERE